MARDRRADMNVPTPKIFGSAFTRGPNTHSRHLPAHQADGERGDQTAQRKVGLVVERDEGEPPISAPGAPR